MSLAGEQYEYGTLPLSSNATWSGEACPYVRVSNRTTDDFSQMSTIEEEPYDLYVCSGVNSSPGSP